MFSVPLRPPSSREVSLQMSSPAPGSQIVMATPDQLDELAAHTLSLGHRVDDIAEAVNAALRDLAAALPGSAAAERAPDAGARCSEVLHAEAEKLRILGRGIAAATAGYRANEERLARRAEGIS
jgi:hypothetical protein